MLTPGFGNQAGDIGLRVTQMSRLLTSILAKFFQLPMRQVPEQGIGRDLVRSFPIRYGCFVDRAE